MAMFNIIVVLDAVKQLITMLNNINLYLSGESGLGKSTLINSLFLTDIYSDRKIPETVGKAFDM